MEEGGDAAGIAGTRDPCGDGNRLGGYRNPGVNAIIACEL
jgi:hypothetical protein